MRALRTSFLLSTSLAVLGLAAIAGGQDTSTDADASAEQARIAFANLGGIRDWRAPDNRTLYVQGRNRQWYRAELFAPCMGLDFANTIGFVVEPSGAFDRFSAVLVEGRQCRLRSLVQSDEPPRRGAGQAGDGPQATREALDEAVTGTASGQTAEGSADGSGQAASQEARIPFANLGGIRNWRAASDEMLYIEGRNRQWYRAELMSPCTGLRFQDAIGFVIEPTGGFDRFSAVLVEGRRCPLRSLTEIDAPPQRD